MTDEAANNLAAAMRELAAAIERSNKPNAWPPTYTPHAPKPNPWGTGTPYSPPTWYAVSHTGGVG